MNRSVEGKRVLVTGGTGFLGGHLVRMLLERGASVRACGRDLDRGRELARMGAEFRPVDLTDRDAVVESCRGMDVVVHAGALSSAWGTDRDFFRANVEGTEHLVTGCLAHAVARLVHVSSPSVVSRPEHRFGLTEDEPFPSEFVSNYAKSKKLAEDVVHTLDGRGTETVIVRPKGIYGPGDTAIVPRIVELARRGRLPIIEPDTAITNLTYVEDACRGILAAMEREAAVGRTYVLTGGEDLALWGVIRRILVKLRIPLPRRRIPLARALSVADALEALWTSLPLPGEPPLNRYKVGLLSYSQTYDISAAERDLGYRPEVSIDEGIERVVAAMTRGTSPSIAVPRATPSSEPTCVGIHYFNAGVVSAPEALFVARGSLSRIAVPSLFAMIRHPKHGVVLYDTGYSHRFIESTERFPERLYRIATPVDIPDDQLAVAHLAAQGVRPEEVRMIVLSHFDPDHYGGLRDFPNATILCGRRAWQSVVGKRGFAALRARMLPGHLPSDMTARLELVDEFESPAVASFDACHDVFGDGALRLVPLEGHARGQLGAFVRTDRGESHFLAADAIWSRASLDHSPRPDLHGFIAVDRRAQAETRDRIRALRDDRAGYVIVPSHCPDAARELAGFRA